MAWSTMTTNAKPQLASVTATQPAAQQDAARAPRSKLWYGLAIPIILVVVGLAHWIDSRLWWSDETGYALCNFQPEGVEASNIKNRNDQFHYRLSVDGQLLIQPSGGIVDQRNVAKEKVKPGFNPMPGSTLDCPDFEINSYNIMTQPIFKKNPRLCFPVIKNGDIAIVAGTVTGKPSKYVMEVRKKGGFRAYLDFPVCPKPEVQLPHTKTFAEIAQEVVLDSLISRRKYPLGYAPGRVWIRVRLIENQKFRCYPELPKNPNPLATVACEPLQSGKYFQKLFIEAKFPDDMGKGVVIPFQMPDPPYSK